MDDKFERVQQELKQVKRFRYMPLALNMGMRLGVAYNISKLDDQPHSTDEKLWATLLPGWYTSFKIAKIAPEKTPKNSWQHTLGKLLVPWQYSAFQMAKLKSPQTTGWEKALAILGGPFYSLYGSTILAERKAMMQRAFVQPPVTIQVEQFTQRPAPYSAVNGYYWASLPVYASPMCRM